LRAASLRRLLQTLMGLCGPPRTPTHPPRTVIGSARPVRCSIHPAGLRWLRLPAGRSRREALPGLSLPFRAHHRDPAPSRRFPGSSDDADSPGLCRPYDTVSGGQIRSVRRQIPLPPRVNVRGLVTPLATCTAHPTGVVHTGASMGFTLQGVPLAHDRYPSRGPCPLGVTATPTHTPEGVLCRNAAVFRASFPWRVRAVTGSTRDPAVDAFLRFSPPELLPSQPGTRVDCGASPLTLGRIDVPTRPGPRVSGCDRGG
jgi:hypothetical protein